MAFVAALFSRELTACASDSTTQESILSNCSKRDLIETTCQTPYKIGGPEAWRAVNLGQTCWVLNESIQGVFRRASLRFIFVACGSDFDADENSPEYWAVDMLNNLELTFMNLEDIKLAVIG